MKKDFFDIQVLRSPNSPYKIVSVTLNGGTHYTLMMPERHSNKHCQILALMQIKVCIEKQLEALEK